MLKRLYKNNRALFALFQTCIILSSLSLIGGEFFKGQLLEGAISRDFSAFVRVAVIYFAIILFNALAFYLYSYSFRIFESKSLRDMRRDYFKSLIAMPFVGFLKEDRGVYLADYTNQMDTITYSYFQSVYGVEQIIWELAFSVISLFVIDFRFALLTIVLMTPASMVPGLFKKKIKTVVVGAIAENNMTTAKFGDYLEGVQEIKDYGAEAAFYRDFESQTSSLKKKEDGVVKVRFGVDFTAGFIVNMCYVALIIAAAFMLSARIISTADFIAAIGIAGRFKVNVGLVTNYMTEFNSVKVPLQKVRRFITSEEQGAADGGAAGSAMPATAANSAAPANTMGGAASANTMGGAATSEPSSSKAPVFVKTIEYENVDFRYPGGDLVLEGFNLKMDKKGIYIFKGESGSGKTTAANLLLNYFQPEKGNISIDGRPVSEIDSLNNLVAINRQETQILNDSIKNNLTLYRDLPEADVMAALAKVDLTEVAQRDGLDKEIKKNKSLSGGEEKRLSIARTLLLDREIIIFDEPFANIDPQSIEKICDLILSIRDKFVIVITHEFPERLRASAVKEVAF